MNVCIYGASSNDIDEEYKDIVGEFAYLMAKRGHNMVFGAGAEGLMGAAAQGVTRGGGSIIGVAPTFLNVDGRLYENCTELIKTETMRERKQIMEERADAFVMVPGGVGTYEEFFEILTLKQLGRHGKAIIIFNIMGYYDAMIYMLKENAEKGFMPASTNELYCVMTNASDILDYLDGYVPEIGKVYKF